MSKMMPVGAKTPYGVIEAIGYKGGERYYMMLKGEVATVMPADVIEKPDGDDR